MNDVDVIQPVELESTSRFKKELEDAAMLALRQERRIMLNSKDQKLVHSVAQDIMDRHEDTKKRGGASGAANILIQNSDVKLLVTALREAVGEA